MPKNACEWAIALQNAQEPIWRDLDTWRRLDSDCTYAIAAALMREREKARDAARAIAKDAMSGWIDPPAWHELWPWLKED